MYLTLRDRGVPIKKNHPYLVGITEIKCFLREHIMAARHESVTIPIIINTDGECFSDTVKVIGYQELKANG